MRRDHRPGGEIYFLYTLGSRRPFSVRSIILVLGVRNFDEIWSFSRTMLLRQVVAAAPRTHSSFFFSAAHEDQGSTVQCFTDTPQRADTPLGGFYVVAHCDAAPCEAQNATFRDLCARYASRSNVNVSSYCH